MRWQEKYHISLAFFGIQLYNKHVKKGEGGNVDEFSK